MMADPLSDSPFAEFAAPRVGAADAYKQRHKQERQARRARWLFLGLLTLITALSTSLAVSVGANFQVFPLALGFAFAGAGLGLLVGWLLGMVSWAGLRSRSNAPFSVNPLGAELVKGNSWDKLTVWLVVWGAAGILCGAVAGSRQAAKGADQGMTEILWLWAWGGALVGFVAASALWLYLRRFAAPRRQEPSS